MGFKTMWKMSPKSAIFYPKARGPWGKPRCRCQPGHFAFWFGLVVQTARSKSSRSLEMPHVGWLGFLWGCPVMPFVDVGLDIVNKCWNSYHLHHLHLDRHCDILILCPHHRHHHHHHHHHHLPSHFLYHHIILVTQDSPPCRVWLYQYVQGCNLRKRQPQPVRSLQMVVVKGPGESPKIPSGWGIIVILPR